MAERNPIPEAQSDATGPTPEGSPAVGRNTGDAAPGPEDVGTMRQAVPADHGTSNRATTDPRAPGVTGRISEGTLDQRVVGSGLSGARGEAAHPDEEETDTTAGVGAGPGDAGKR